VSFSAKKFGVFTVNGSMGLVEGTFTVAAPIDRSSLHAVLAADSFRTPMANRDKHVKGKSLLDVEAHPLIEFDSTSIAPVVTGWEVHGLLTAHGTVAPAVLAVIEASEKGGRVRVTALARVDRRSVGVKGMRAAASACIEVRIEAVGVRVGDGTQAA
jgi:polyisoprenoid-binding protein YceI